VRRTITGGQRSVRRPEPGWQRKDFDERFGSIGVPGISLWKIRGCGYTQRGPTLPEDRLLEWRLGRCEGHHGDRKADGKKSSG
jgi:hypothetical protein